MKVSTDERDKISNIVSQAEYSNGELHTPSIASLAIRLHISDDDLLDVYDVSNFVLKKPLARYRGKIPKSDIGYYIDAIIRLLEDPFVDANLYVKLPFKLNDLGQNGYRMNDKVSIVNASAKLTETIDRENIFTDMTKQQQDIYSIVSGVSYDPSRDNSRTSPNYRIPDNSRSYLKVITKASFRKGNIQTIDIDPLHIFKVITSVALCHEIVSEDGLLRYLLNHNFLNHQDEHKDTGLILAYDMSMKYMASRSLQYNELEFLNKISELEGISDSKKLNLFEVISSLINKHSNSYLERERIRIINSLYWYFEYKATENIGFKTLLLVSMFDAFSPSDVKMSNDVTIRSIINNAGFKEKSTEHELLKIAYKKRNDVAHGKIHLLHTDSERGSLVLSESQMGDIEQNIYKKYINNKVKLFME